MALTLFPSIRSHQTWGQKVPSENRPGQPCQHRHVQETPLPGGKTVIASDVCWTRRWIWLWSSNLWQVSVCPVFKEVTLELAVDEQVRTRLLEDVLVMKERDYRQTCGSRWELWSQWCRWRKKGQNKNWSADCWEYLNTMLKVWKLAPSPKCALWSNIHSTGTRVLDSDAHSSVLLIDGNW